MLIRQKLPEILLEITKAAQEPGGLDRILTETQYARMKNVSRDTIRREFRAGKGPPRVRLSDRRVGFRLRDIIADIAQNTEKPGSRSGA
jgi:predicted DNA-binding transcriptional regulator AlpA